MQIEINLPDFIGFYNSPLDPGEFIEIVPTEELESHGDMDQEQYDSINWNKTHEATAKKYLYKFIDQNEAPINLFGIKLEFVKVDSPKYYNYSTDKLVCKATFNKQKLIRYIKTLLKVKENYLRLDEYIKDTFSSRSGFISFYSNNTHYWINDLLPKIETDNVIFETFLFNLVTSADYDRDELIDQTMDCSNELIVYN